VGSDNKLNSAKVKLDMPLKDMHLDNQCFENQHLDNQHVGIVLRTRFTLPPDHPAHACIIVCKPMVKICAAL
jgi:hypothetical protein